MSTRSHRVGQRFRTINGTRLRWLPGLAELELEPGRERRAGAREARRTRGQHIGRPGAVDTHKMELARRMHASGAPANTVAAALGVSRATVYRVLAE
jgi:DNA invertase Pin-like site-specific DNA recombinase